MTRARQPAYQRVAVHHEHIVDDISRSDFTIDAWATITPDGAVAAVNAHPRIGPGLGPHTTPNHEWITAIGWAFINCGHAMRRTLHLGPPDPASTEIPGQLTLEDAS